MSHYSIRFCSAPPLTDHDVAVLVVLRVRVACICKHDSWTADICSLHVRLLHVPTHAVFAFT